VCYSSGFGPNSKPIFVGQSKGGKVWGPKRKPRPKSHYKPKNNLGLDSEVKPASPVSLGGEFNMPIPSSDPTEKSLEVFLATTTAFGVVRGDGLSPAFAWPVDWHTGPSLIRFDQAEL
jgi:hypothetical protein